MKKLPTGIQTFAKVREEDYYLVDKTKLIVELLENGSFYFLSRPRRFGKSLFLDTLREAFLGNKELFNGLYLEKNWDWTKKYPVIRISFGGGSVYQTEDLEIVIREILEENASNYEIKLSRESIQGRFRELIILLEKKYSTKVVVLIDEYDKPILDNITNKEIANGMRDRLKNLYSVMKDADAFIKFVFITGVSKFSRVSLFSGLNNLKDITIDERYATICGYTEPELTVFEDRLKDVNRDELKLWYNGYNFMGESVYNPYDILLFLDSKVYKNYWFESGTPTFLIKLIQERNYNIPNMENIKITDSILSSFDVDSILLESLLFQTGYLTIKNVKSIGGAGNVYYLKFPNQEVKASLTDTILHFLTDNITPKEENKIALYEALQTGKLDSIRKIFHSFFASIPHDWYRKNQLANYEGYYASIFYCYFTALGLIVHVEDVTNQGQVDMTVFFENKVYILEFKVIEMTEAGSALAQIKEKKYYEKYITVDNREIYLLGVEFSKDNKNIVNFEWDRIFLNKKNSEL